MDEGVVDGSVFLRKIGHHVFTGAFIAGADFHLIAMTHCIRSPQTPSRIMEDRAFVSSSNKIIISC